MIESHKIDFDGHQLTLVLDDATAEDIIRVAGHALEIPAGCNTVTKLFRDAAGNAALGYRQRGFDPIASDDEHEINGSGVIIINNSADLPDLQAAEILNKFKREVIES